MFEQCKNKPFTCFDSFDQSIDGFFAKIEEQKDEIKAQSQQETAVKKLEAIKKDQQTRVKGLEQAQEANFYRACLIEENLDIVDEAIQRIKEAVDSGRDWKELEQENKELAKGGDEIAQHICGMQLSKRKITILLRYIYIYPCCLF